LSHEAHKSVVTEGRCDRTPCDGTPLPAALVDRRDDSKQSSTLPQHDGVGLYTLGNDGNCCIVEAPPCGLEIAVPVAPGATVVPGSVGDTDSRPTPVQGRPLVEFLPGFGWIKVLGSAGGTLSSDCACKSVLCPLSTGLVVFWASAAVAIRMVAPTPISPMRSATIVNLPNRATRALSESWARHHHIDLGQSKWIIAASRRPGQSRNWTPALWCATPAGKSSAIFITRMSLAGDQRPSY
jgi:hypothetical protein